MIAIGADYGGPELKGTVLNTSLMRLSSAFRKLRPAATDADILLNPIFCVPGSVSGPLPLQGIQYGKFSRKPLCLAVTVAVPVEQVASLDPMPFLVNALRGCNAMAFEFYRQRGLKFPLAEAELLVTHVAKAVSHGEQ